MMLDVMSRHEGWAVLVCLIGGGQEINSGEAGLAEWGTALRSFESGRFMRRLRFWLRSQKALFFFSDRRTHILPGSEEWSSFTSRSATGLSVQSICQSGSMPSLEATATQRNILPRK